MEVMLYEENTMGPAYNEHPATTSRSLYIRIIDCNVKKFAYNEPPLITSSFFLLVVSGAQCTGTDLATTSSVTTSNRL